MQTISELLADLNNDDISVDQAIAVLVEQTTSAVVADTRINANVAQHYEQLVRGLGQQISEAVQLLQVKVDYLQKQLAAYQNKADQDAPQFIDQLAVMINDNASALDAQNVYDLYWFQQLPYSIACKQRIADRLISLVQNYNTSYVSTLWQSITSFDPDILDAIAFHTT